MSPEGPDGRVGGRGPDGRVGGRGPDGIALVDKEAGWTSHDVVARARKVLGTKKVCHAGTLDPPATGLLVLGVGRGTRLLRFLTASRKRYIGELVLGVETTTLDAEGEVTARHDMAYAAPADVERVAGTFKGEIRQIPPMVSAKQVGGRRLHELAREGVEVERQPQVVTIHDLAVAPVAGDDAAYRLDVTCSSGTYIRTLAADIGAALGGGAHLRSLRRLEVGAFSVDEARAVDDLELRPLAEAVGDLPGVAADESLAALIANGRVLDRDELGVSGDGPWAVMGPGGALLAVYEPHTDDRIKPAVVVAPSG